MYEVVFAPPAERYLKKLKNKRLKEKFREAVKLISENPYITSRMRKSVIYPAFARMMSGTMV